MYAGFQGQSDLKEVHLSFRNCARSQRFAHYYRIILHDESKDHASDYGNHQSFLIGGKFLFTSVHSGGNIEFQKLFPISA